MTAWELDHGGRNKMVVKEKKKEIRMKKYIFVLAVIICAFASLAVLPAQNSYAANDCGFSSPLGLKPWYSGLVKGSAGSCEVDHSQFKCEKDENGEGDCPLQKSIYKIVMNLASDVLAIVGYLAICMVIWGGYQYMMAQGDPGKVAKGKKTITNSLIGLAICMLASTITSTLSNIANEAAADGANVFVVAMNHAFIWAGIISVIMVVFGGIQYTTSNGNPSQAQKAKQTIMYSLIGLAISIFAVAIVNLVVGAIEQ